MSLSLSRTAHQALRLGAAVLTVALVLLLGGLGTDEPAAPTYHHYVALGDSYTSAPYVPLTDVAYGCLRSSNNYPHRVAAALHIEDLRDRSCSGAGTGDLPGSQTTPRGMRVPPQLDALTVATDLVTVSIGFNDFHLYAQMASVCRRSRRICPLYDQRGTLNDIVDRLRPALEATLALVRAGAPHARILLVSYPKLLPPHGDCARLPRMRERDRATFRAVNLRLRNQMRAAAADAAVEFVDFYRASLGHDVCSAHPWIQGRIGSRHAGAPLHPLPAGQAALARVLVQVLRSEPPPA